MDQDPRLILAFTSWMGLVRGRRFQRPHLHRSFQCWGMVRLLWETSSTFLAVGTALTPLTPKAEAPEPRSYHCMTSLGDSLYVFGGCGAAGRGRLNDLWKYDTGTGKWSCLSPGGDDCPRGRGGSSLLSLQGTGGAPDQLVLTYGFCGEQVADVHMFDLRSGSWNDLSAEQTGDLPGPRSVFATALIPGGRMILVGGEQEESALGHAGAGKFAGDCYLLELPSLKWVRLLTGSEKPGPLARGWSQCAYMSKLDSVVLFGGLDHENARLGDAWMLNVKQLSNL
eukprot:TRINITY_DN23915_c0_g1_i3.p1 TRINITY_DN23915_c0_g1~~TRINITY_DN23915_c0_g1_i3.p1  ORF type:complete len:282 (+),score=27.39 TRINITY_DN23915_c0_g1_i3:245-1090(+)